MRVLWDILQSSTSLPLFFLQFRAPPSLFLSLFLFLHWSIISKLLIQGPSWWQSSFFLGLFPCGWCLLSPFLLCLPLHLHGGKSPLKDLIEAQIFSLHRSSISKLPSSGNQSTRASCRCSLNLLNQSTILKKNLVLALVFTIIVSA